MEYKYNHIACGGTFDRLHKGHEAFLRFAFSAAAKVSIGITTDEMVKNIGKVGTQTFAVRKDAVVDLLEKEGFLARAEVINLNDIYGTTLSDETIDAILATVDSLDGAEEINRKRKEEGLAPLGVVLFDLVRAEDGSTISSTHVRVGKINRQGLVYKVPGTPADFLITEDLRQKLGEPQGELYDTLDEDLLAKLKVRNNLLITVGDEVTRTLLKARVEPDLIVADLIINRKKAFGNISELIGESKRQVTKAVNNRGTISNTLIDAVGNYFGNTEKQTVIEVDGEEDLAVLPIVLLAPLSTVIVYGLRDRGMVVINVTEQKKEEFLNYLEQFKKVSA